MNAQLSSKEMLLDICSLEKQANQLLTKDRPYANVLKVLTKRNYHPVDENSSIPTLKEISAETGISYNKVRQYIRKIYEDLVLGSENDEILRLSFEKVIYGFSVRGIYKNSYVYFEVDHLPVTPRVGEEIELPFFNAFLGTYSFYVERVSHDFFAERQIVNIFLKPGSYSLYWHYQKDKAIDEKEISLRKLIDLDDYELKSMLGIGR